MGRTFVGFGFGPIQSALFLYEAFVSGNFSRFVVAEVDRGLVEAVRGSGGGYSINIARPDRIDRARVEVVELLNPADADDRARLVEAIASADEMATALPSVDFYDRGDSSVAALLAEGLRRRSGRPALIYAAENHNHAAEILARRIEDRGVQTAATGAQAVNTVIGKMSGVIADPAEISRLGLATLTPGSTRAVLVEEFNRILISRVRLGGFERGIQVFIEKDDLLPFEEAKLYGHNAIHALIGYLADRRGLRSMAEAGHDEWIMRTARSAFLDESGSALISRHKSLGDELFTPAGYRAYAEDLLDRMVRPTLYDLVERVVRDPARKLGWDDRIFGTMRLALTHGIEPRNMALGAAAALHRLARERGLGRPTADSAGELLRSVWNRPPDDEALRLAELTAKALAFV